MIKDLFRFISGIIRLALLLIVLAVIFHAWAIKQVLTYSLSYVLGADVTIQEVKMDWKNTGFEVHGLEIMNPYDFPRDRLADIPLVIVSADMASIPQGRLRLKTVGFNLRELQVMNAAQQGLNVLALKPLQRAKGVEAPSGSGSRGSRGGSKVTPFSIGELIFSIGDITYLDMSRGVTKQNRFRVGIQGATYYDIRGADDIVVLVITETLKKMGFGALNAQFQKLQDKHFSNAVSDGNFFDSAVSSIKEKMSS